MIFLPQINVAIQAKQRRPYIRKMPPKILYGILRNVRRPIPPPIARRVVAKVIEPKYDVVYPYGLGGEWEINLVNILLKMANLDIYIIKNGRFIFLEIYK